MKIQTIVSAYGTHVRIRRDDIDITVLLSEKDSLEQKAQEMREKALRMLRRAEIIDEAARYLAAREQAEAKQ